MSEYRRRPEKEPEVFQFPKETNHKTQLIEGHRLAMWAYGVCLPLAHVSVRSATDGFTAKGVHVKGYIPGTARSGREEVFTLHPGEFLVWENDEFRVYAEAEFNKVFEARPQLAIPSI